MAGSSCVSRRRWKPQERAQFFEFLPNQTEPKPLTSKLKENLNFSKQSMNFSLEGSRARSSSIPSPGSRPFRLLDRFPPFAFRVFNSLTASADLCRCATSSSMSSSAWLSICWKVGEQWVRVRPLPCFAFKWGRARSHGGHSRAAPPKRFCCVQKKLF